MAEKRKTVGVRAMGDGIEVRFVYQGATVRPRLRLKATSANLMHANRLRQQIVKEITQGTFNMLTHFPDYKLADKVFWNTTLGRPWHDEQMQRNIWRLALRRCGIRHRPPKELRDSSVTFALQAGADPWYVARQHGHSLTVMMKDYAKWIPNADRNRNRNAINTTLAAPIVDVGNVQKIKQP